MLPLPIKKFLYHFFYGNYFIALGAFCLALEPYVLLDIPFSENTWYWALLIFFLTHFAYQLQRLRNTRFFLLNHKLFRHQWIEKHYYLHKKLALFSLFIIVILILLNIENVRGLLALVPSGIISFFYNLRYKKFEGLRNVPHLKTLLIAFTWALVFSLPDGVTGVFSSKTCLFLFMNNLFFIYSITLPFDIRDMKRDKPELRTLPQVIGIIPTKIISVFSFFLSGCCILILNPGVWPSPIITGLMLMIFLTYAQPDTSDILFLLGFDSLIIIKVFSEFLTQTFFC